MLNTGWKDYADPYMWCCGCIPPVRLNPICYRFGAKEAKVQPAPEGGVDSASFMLRSAFHVFYITMVPSEASLSGQFLYLAVSVFLLLLEKKKKSDRAQRILAHVEAVISFLLNSYFSNYFIFPLWLSRAPNPSAVFSRMWLQLSTHVDFHIEAHKR